MMAAHTKLLIIADEGIREYADEQERVLNCESWYGYVIDEARRRGIMRLAEIESQFLEHERALHQMTALISKRAQVTSLKTRKRWA
jgi:hypothetical protein